MKLITAIIQPDKLDIVREALIDAEITRITVSRVTGHGRRMEEDLYRGKKVVPNLTSKIRLDIAVNDEFEKITCDAIIKGSRSENGGEIGDGKIFVVSLEKCIRISTGETGGQAI